MYFTDRACSIIIPNADGNYEAHLYDSEFSKTAD
jgi:hypothetical protein